MNLATNGKTLTKIKPTARNSFEFFVERNKSRIFQLGRINLAEEIGVYGCMKCSLQWLLGFPEGQACFPEIQA